MRVGRHYREWLFFKAALSNLKLLLLKNGWHYNCIYFVLFVQSTGFVRHNTPHPKDLKAKFQKWFGGAKPKARNVDKVFVAPDENVSGNNTT